MTKNNVLRKNKDLFLGYIVLDPRKVGPVEQKLIVTLTGQRSNKTFSLEVPIIGSVYDSEKSFREGFDITSFTSDVAPRRKLNEVLKLEKGVIQDAFVVKNSFNVPIKLKGLYNFGNPEVTITNQ